MRLLSPVVWHEGMHLSQHHFQAQSRYVEELVSFFLTELAFAPYGLAGYEFDVEALRNDTLTLTHGRGIMPDGLVFHFPDDPLPESRDVRALFSPTEDSQRVLLAIPALRRGQANTVLADAAGSPNGLRFHAASRPVTDEAGGTDEKPVVFAQKNFRLLLESEDSSGLVTLPLARIRRDGSGHFAFDDNYVPPCVQFGASARLTSMLHRLVEALTARGEALVGERSTSPGELLPFWLSNAVNASLAPLIHLLETRRAHPEQLFVEISRLGGALATFSLNAHPRDLPLYDHDRLDECFGALERQVHGLLDTVLPNRCVRVALRPQGEAYFVGEVTDGRCFGTSQWYLGVRSSTTPAEVAARVPRLAKICSAKFIERLVREALTGLQPEYVTSPPSEISPRLGTSYFLLPRTGPCWSSIVETRTVGVYAPDAIPDAELELAIALP